MIDYLWGWEGVNAERMCNALLGFRPDADPTTLVVREVGGGTLVTIGEAYPGFDPIETDSQLLVVLGGPKPIQEVHFEQVGDTPKYSEWLLCRWTEDVSDLAFGVVGGFQLVRINKVDEFAEILTDSAGFVPCYATDALREGDEAGLALFGSHADAVASAAGLEKTVDRISVADFLMYQTVTYPHTMYLGVTQLPPGHRLESRNHAELEAECYWSPKEKIRYSTIEDGAQELREILKSNVNAVVADETAATILMSGGEDSRVAMCAVPERVEKRALTVTDFFNHEAKVARNISEKLGASWSLLERSPTHYLDYAEVSVALAESHNFFYHAHFNGFQQDIGRERPVLGGLMADAFCKGSHVRKGKRFEVESSIDWDRWDYLGTPRAFHPGDELQAQVLERRESRNEALKALRPQNWAEWHSLFPATMNTNAANYFIDRRLFCSWEPFADPKIVVWSASVDPQWKLNRRLFQRAVKPLLNKVKMQRHAKGTFPYLGWQINGPLAWLLGRFESIRRRYRSLLGISKRNHGPWPVWKEVVSQERFHSLADFRDPTERYRLAEFLGADIVELIERALQDKDPVQRLAGLQVRVWAGKLVLQHSDNSATDANEA